jgi:hypothetical protein
MSLVCPTCGKKYRTLSLYNKHVAACGQNSGEAKNQHPSPVVSLSIPQDTVVEAMQCLEEGYEPVEIMQKLKVSAGDMMAIITLWKQMRTLLERISSPLDVLSYTAEKMGEYARGRCQHYDPESGVCMFWELKGLEQAERNKYRTLFRVAGRATRFNVYKHPEVCSLCMYNTVKPAKEVKT